VVFLGALVAIMTQWLTAKMRQLESGLTPVATRNHLVVLGWTNRTLPLVAEILQSSGRVQRFLADRHASRLRLVILCEEVTPWHAQALHDDPAIGRRGRHIVLRTGTPLVMDDLQRVDCSNAAAVIVPSGASGSGRSADMATVKALLSLSNMANQRDTGLPYVVAEIQDPRMVAVAQRAYRGSLEVISGNSLISRLLAQNMRHSGLSRVYGELLSHQVGCSIYVRDLPALSGLTVIEAQAHFHDAVVCGVVRWTADAFVPHLNPPAEMVLEAGDRLVFIARGYAGTEPKSPGAQPSQLRSKLEPVLEAAPSPPCIPERAASWCWAGTVGWRRWLMSWIPIRMSVSI
jgi:ion channel POLLUX/CASTOR